jgi:predicted permease
MDMAGVVAPVFALVLVGFLLRRIRFPGDDFWPYCERLVYFVLFPALLVSRLSVVTLTGELVTDLAIALVVPTLLVSGALLVLRPLVPVPAATFTSVFQGAIRFNTYVALAVGAALDPGRGLELTAIIAAFMIPLVNLLCVSLLVLLGDRQRSDWGVLLVRGLATNPLILACLAGLAINASGLTLPGFARDTAQLLGQTALPLGLLAVGAGLALRLSSGQFGAVALSSIAKLLALPLLAWLSCRWLEVPPGPTRIVVMFAALPTASSAYILARQMGGDHQTMAGIITVQTLVAMLTLPWVLESLG